MTQIESNKTQTKETSVPKPSSFSTQNKDDFNFTSPLGKYFKTALDSFCPPLVGSFSPFILVTNSISTSTETDRLPPIIKARTPLREGHEPSKKPSPREKRKIDPNEIVTQGKMNKIERILYFF